MSFAAPALAEGDLVACGTPVSTDLNTTAVRDFCDIYTRQLAYNDEHKHLTSQLKERQKNYAAPREEAYKNYLKDRDRLWSSGNAGNE